MKKAGAVLLSGMLLAGGAVAHAEQRMQGYVGISYAELEQYDRFFGQGRYETGEVFARIGGHLNEIFTSELRIGTTLNDESGTSSVGVRDYRHDYIITMMLQAGHEIGIFRPYVGAGYSYVRERVTLVNGNEVTGSFDDITVAGGVDIYLGERVGLNLEFTQYYDTENLRLKGPSAGLIWRF
ncbi:outer membrane beta-barrel protein [Isoalcanivorax indicus]|uniref:outer membrane beta-barrel protein n=1 Tax=Isoalcanivorax indicus TaxID=2202653 RepID=UPI0013C46BAF|nr:outer membrane beta-barrel protein [Isoalcanivorax indicus]